MGRSGFGAVLALVLGFCMILPTTAFAQGLNGSGTLNNAAPTQTGRIARNGVPSDCSGNKPYPGTQTLVGARAFRSFTVTNTTGSTHCYAVITTFPNHDGLNAGTVAYLGSFDPSNVATNYLGDSGSSFTDSSTFGVNLPAGQSMVIVVHDINAGPPASGTTFTITVPDPIPTLEPLSMALLVLLFGGAGLAFLAYRRRTAR